MRALPILAAFAALALFGCHKEEQPTPKTVASVEKQIEDVKNDPKMPENIKAMVLGQLEGEKARIQRANASK